MSNNNNASSSQGLRALMSQRQSQRTPRSDAPRQRRQRQRKHRQEEEKKPATYNATADDFPSLGASSTSSSSSSAWGSASSKDVITMAAKPPAPKPTSGIAKRAPKDTSGWVPQPVALAKQPEKKTVMPPSLVDTTEGDEEDMAEWKRLLSEM